MEEGTPTESTAVHRTIERGESHEIHTQPRLKRSTLVRGKSGEPATPYDAFVSGFRTTFSLSEGDDGADTDFSRDTSQLIQGQDGSWQGSQSSRENPFNRTPDSENHVRAFGSEDNSSTMSAGEHHQPFGTMFAGDTGHTNATFSAELEGDSSSANRDGASTEPGGVNGLTTGGQYGSSDDRSDEMRGSQQNMDLKFQAGSARDDGSVSVEYQQQQASFDNGDQDDKPLIDDDAAEDGNYENQVDQENIDPSKMPLSKLFKTTKAKKSKKGKDKDGTDNSSVASDDVTKSSVTSESQPQTIVEKSTEDVTLTPSSDDVIVTPSSDDVTKTAENEVTGKVPFEDDAKEGKETDVTGDEPNASDGKTDLAAGDDTPAVLYTTENRDVTMTMGEGPQLTQSAGGVAVEGQPIKADGSLPPETGREKESLLRDHNPEGMICCTIL